MELHQWYPIFILPVKNSPAFYRLLKPYSEDIRGLDKVNFINLYFLLRYYKRLDVCENDFIERYLHQPRDENDFTATIGAASQENCSSSRLWEPEEVSAGLFVFAL